MTLRGAGVALVLIIVAVVAFGRGAEALTSQYAVKVVTISVTVTPSPPPVAYIPGRAVRGAHPRRAFARSIAMPGAPELIAQATTGQKSAKVTVTTKADPYAMYLNITPNAVALNASYGSNTYTCAFTIKGYFPKVWKITDWVNGSVAGGGGSFPTWDYPTPSSLAWFAETISTGYTTFSNQGSPGELTFNGAANVTKTICIDLQLTVPNNTAPGSYSTSVQYTLYVTT